jgi:ankyrin repeat protein
MISRPIEDILRGLEELERGRPGVPGLPPTLAAAARSGDLAAVELFLARGAPLDEPATGSRSVLEAAISGGDARVVERLLAAGAPPDSPGAAGRAARHGRIDLLEKLFDAGLAPDHREAQEAAVQAAIGGRASTLRWLVARRVEVPATEVSFAAMLAEHGGHPEIAAFLRGGPVDLASVPSAPPERAVIGVAVDPVAQAAARAELERRALAALGSGALDDDLRARDRLGRSLLTAAIEEALPAFAEALLERGADPADGGPEGACPLLAAAAHGQVGVLRALVARGERPDWSADDDADPALVAAARHGLPEAVEALLAAGADPRAASAAGETAMTVACGPFRDEIRALLRRAAARQGVARPAALVACGRPRRERLAADAGVRAFVRKLEESHPEWTLLAVAAPIERVTPALAAAQRAAAVRFDVARAGVDAARHGVFVVQFEDHPWTLELLALGRSDRSAPVAELDRTATGLSRQLATTVVGFYGSDVAVSCGVHVDRDGERIETIDTAEAGALDGIDRRLRELGLALPALTERGDGYCARLEIHGLSIEAVRRLDYLVLRD